MTIVALGTADARDSNPGTEEANASENPLQMIVSIGEQRIKVFRGTELVTSSPVSSGKRGHSTPTGVFSILEKRRRHFSNLYNNAPMPFMQRLTWSGVALHQGRLPGYPASHGCIRMPMKFAKSLFSMTDRGMHVLVTEDGAEPQEISHAVLPQPSLRPREVASLSAANIAANPALRGALSPASIETDLAVQAPANPDFDQPLRMIISPQPKLGKVRVLQRLLNDMGFNAGTEDGITGRKTRAAISLYQEGADLPVTGEITDSLVARIHADAGYEEPKNAMLRVRRKFNDIYEAPVELIDADKDIGTYVFTALDFKEGDESVSWMVVSAEGNRGGSPKSVLDRVVISKTVARDLARMLTPGTSLTVTDRGFARNTGLGTDFVVITR